LRAHANLEPRLLQRALCLNFAPAGWLNGGASTCGFPSEGPRMTSAMPARPAATAKRVLVVEDELMIRMLLEDMLGELGYTVAAEAGHLDEALEATKTAEFDLAILDVNLDGQPISPVADALVARGTPFVFATGYGERGLPEPYRDRPMLKKPFQIEGLKQMLEAALERETT
jgi:CheY-like chemotaxis protein